MAIITIEGMEFLSYHGCFAEEQIIGTNFIVDLEMAVDVSTAETTDDLSETINYQSVYTLIKTEMAQKSRLLENVARRVVDKVKDSFPQIQWLKVKVSKLNPPLGGKINRVCVIIEHNGYK